ncbi:hypothetical protein GCM10011348_46240 [Marinobacterium nitratireducens]|uniref:Uncharacterized protein n=1 Tax=Marinobacterium nitratireducens TaxID=518897 RepID=A0A917ZRG2_9GAMM|nr:hypothetical protein [Marinobacterium nitratireducens]GGO89154.1 hypothetical protein GCM10011348_46240 [Marinobacterium nitratireducens]
MTTCERIYRSKRIQGHPVQYLATALLIKYLMARYPWSWQRRNERKKRDPQQLDATEFLVLHIRNEEARITA